MLAVSAYNGIDESAPSVAVRSAAEGQSFAEQCPTPPAWCSGGSYGGLPALDPVIEDDPEPSGPEEAVAGTYPYSALGTPMPQDLEPALFTMCAIPTAVIVDKEPTQLMSTEPFHSVGERTSSNHSIRSIGQGARALYQDQNSWPGHACSLFKTKLPLTSHPLSPDNSTPSTCEISCIEQTQHALHAFSYQVLPLPPSTLQVLTRSR